MISYDTLSEAEMAERGEIPQDEIRESVETYGKIGIPQDTLTKPRDAEDGDDKHNAETEAQNKIVQEIVEQVQSISEQLGTLLHEYQVYQNSFENSKIFNFLNELPQIQQAFQIDTLQNDIGELQQEETSLLLLLEKKSTSVEDRLTETNIFLKNLKTKFDIISTDLLSLNDALLQTQSTINTQTSDAQSSTQIFDELNQELYSLPYEVDRLVQLHSQVINQIQELEAKATQLTNSINK